MVDSISDKSKNYHKKASTNISITLLLSFLFNIIVICGGLYTNSVAILSDSIHEVADTLCIFISWVLEKASLKNPDDKYTYGYQRLSLLSALITSFFVIGASIFVLYESFTRIFYIIKPDAKGMFIFGIIGIIFKGYSFYKVYNGQTYNEKAISFHLLGDLLEWVAILILSIILMFSDLVILDPIISLIIAIWLIYSLGKTSIESIRIFLQKVPDQYNLKEIKEKILKIDNVCEIINIHLWSLDGIALILTCKLKVKTTNKDDLIQIRNDISKISKEYDVIEETVEFIFN